MTHIEIILSVSSVIFGIASLLIASRARKRLSSGLIRSYIDSFSVCLSFIVIFSIWMAIRYIFNFEVAYGVHAVVFPEYIFLAFTYLAFIIASYRVLHISHAFGFKEEGSNIQKILDQKQKMPNKK